MSAAWSRRIRVPVADSLLVGLVAAIVYALHGYHGTMDRDLGVFTYGGEHVASGVPPYAGIFNSVGPLADAVPGLAIWAGHLVGLGPVSAERHLFTLLSAGCCVLLSVLARDVLGSRAAGFVAPAVFLTFEDFSWLASDGPREKTTMVLFLLGALVLVGRRRWLGAGVCTALATLAWQPVLAVAVTAAVVAALGDRSDRLRAAVAFVGGGVIPTAAVVLYYVIYGDLRLALNGFLVVNAKYTQQPSLLTSPHHTWTFLWSAYHDSLWVLLAGLAALFVMTAAALPQVVRRPPAPPGAPSPIATLSIGAAAVVGTAWTVAVINGPPDLFELLPFGALGVAGAVVRIAARLEPRLAWAVVAATTVVATGAAGLQEVATRNDGLDRQRADVAAVLATAPADATVLSVNAPEVPALAGRNDPSIYQVFDQPMTNYLQHDYPGGLAGYTAWIAHVRPTFIVIGRHCKAPWLDAMLARRYRRIGRGPIWTWYVSRSAGPLESAAAATANRAVMDRQAPDLSATRAVARPGRFLVELPRD